MSGNVVTYVLVFVGLFLKCRITWYPYQDVIPDTNPESVYMRKKNEFKTDSE